MRVRPGLPPHLPPSASRTASLRGWRALALGAAGLVLLALLGVVLFWAAVGVAAALAVAVLNVVYLPRLARRLGAPALVLGLALLPLLAALGWWAGGGVGAALGAAAWLVLVGLPRLAAAYVARGLRQAGAGGLRVVRVGAAPPGPFAAATGARPGVACLGCGLVSFPQPHERLVCPACGAPLPT